jgi:hypothetical protein
MDGIISLFLALIAALVALVPGWRVFASVRPQWSIDPARCMSCETPMSLRRVSIISSRMLGQWECTHCGTKMNKRGRVAGTVG